MDGQQERTKEELFLDLPPATDDFNSPQYSIFLDSLFSLGEISNTTFEIFPGFVVTLRILSPIEQVEVMKKVDEAVGSFSRNLILKIETLSRAITKVNGQHLRFSDTMIKEWQDFRGATKDRPTDVEQQRFLITYRFKFFIIDECFHKYEELIKKQEEVFRSLKKSSTLTPS